MAAGLTGSAGLTVDRSDVADLDPFDLLDTESERVATFFETDDENVWAADTRCAGWNVRDLLAHLAGVETYHLACLDDRLAEFFDEGRNAGATNMDSFNDWLIRLRSDRPRAEILDEWRTKNAEVRRRLRERAGGDMASSVGPYPVDLMAFHIASEYATHYDDMAGHLDDAARTAWRAKVSLFGVKEAAKPVEVTRYADTYVVRSGDSEAGLSEADFVEAVTARPTTAPLPDDLRQALKALA